MLAISIFKPYFTLIHRFTRAWMGDFMTNLEQTLELMLLYSDQLLVHTTAALPKVYKMKHIAVFFSIFRPTFLASNLSVYI